MLAALLGMRQATMRALARHQWKASERGLDGWQYMFFLFSKETRDQHRFSLDNQLAQWFATWLVVYFFSLGLSG